MNHNAGRSASSPVHRGHNLLFGVVLLRCILIHILPLKVAKISIVEFANRVDPDEAAHNEPPHLG